MMGTAEMRNSQRELQQFQLRIGVAGIVMLIAFGILVARFFFLQVVQHEHYRSKAEDNRISIVPIPPNRGLITDRNGVVVLHAGNLPAPREERGGNHRRARRADRNHAARPRALQAPHGGNPQPRKPADPHAPQRRRRRQVRGQPLPL
jgi:hypothetical protein